MPKRESKSNTQRSKREKLPQVAPEEIKQEGQKSITDFKRKKTASKDEPREEKAIPMTRVSQLPQFS